jgi:signal transduction histidine kinase/DNA-binding response OmpR family regulator/HPt (histidine-containing phosphotransfer) domain-containing protein
MNQAFQLKAQLIHLKTGERRTCLTIAIPSVGKDGSLLFNGYLADMTLQEQQDRQLLAARDKAEAATRAKSMFLANMSHEIRTPMNAIIGLSHLALRTGLSGKQKDYVEKIHQAGNSLLGVLNDILDFSKIEAGKLDIENVDFCLDDLLTNMVTITHAKAEEKRLEYLFEIAPDIPAYLNGDPLRLSQILINLVNNALKFTEKGEVQVSAKVLATEASRVHLQFCIRDTGIGMSAEQCSHLFEAFVQADGSTTRKFGGTGLGLSICRRLVELMEGKIWAESQEGAGSYFWFDIWLHLSEFQGVQDQAALSSQWTGRSALVVDDHPVARDILSGMLQSLQIDTTVADCGEAALLAIRNAQKPYDLVLTDLQMPRMSGIELLHSIRQEFTNPPKCILLRAYGSMDSRLDGSLAGLSGLMVKPVLMSKLKKALEEAFSAKQSDVWDASLSNQLPQFQHVRILMVDDNKINQQIVVELLELTGIAVDLADHGRIALEKLDAHPSNYYQLVLMDIQMPIMDGHEATSAIRRDNKYKDLPIIAMTANAMRDEQSICLAEGMNDHLSKPIVPEMLYAKLMEFLPASSLQKVGKVVNASIDKTLPGILPGLDLMIARRSVGGNEKLLVKLLRHFSLEQHDAVEQMRMALLSGDPLLADRLIHTLKGLAGSLGAQKLALIAMEVEQQFGQTKDVPQLDAILNALNQEVQLVCVSIDSAFGSDTQMFTDFKVRAMNDWGTDLHHLSHLLSESDIDAISMFDDFSMAFSASFGAAAAQELHKHLENFEMDAAYSQIMALVKEHAIVMQNDEV